MSEPEEQAEKTPKMNKHSTSSSSSNSSGGGGSSKAPTNAAGQGGAYLHVPLGLLGRVDSWLYV